MGETICVASWIATSRRAALCDSERAIFLSSPFLVPVQTDLYDLFLFPFFKLCVLLKGEDGW